MTRPINPDNSERSNDRRRPYPSNPNQNRNRNNPNRRDYKNPKHSKFMILLKSTVIALFIVLLVLVAAFFTFKSNKAISAKFGINAKCKNNSIKVSGEIDEIIADRKGVLVLTKKDSSGKQELIRLHGKCLEEKARVSFRK